MRFSNIKMLQDWTRSQQLKITEREEVQRKAEEKVRLAKEDQYVFSRFDMWKTAIEEGISLRADAGAWEYTHDVVDDHDVITLDLRAADMIVRHFERFGCQATHNNNHQKTKILSITINWHIHG